MTCYKKHIIGVAGPLTGSRSDYGALLKEVLNSKVELSYDRSSA